MWPPLLLQIGRWWPEPIKISATPVGDRVENRREPAPETAGGLHTNPALSTTQNEVGGKSILTLVTINKTHW